MAEEIYADDEDLDEENDDEEEEEEENISEDGDKPTSKKIRLEDELE
jgi:hypothetical protein